MKVSNYEKNMIVIVIMIILIIAITNHYELDMLFWPLIIIAIIIWIIISPFKYKNND